MATEQPRQSLPPKPLAPARDKRIVAAQLVSISLQRRVERTRSIRDLVADLVVAVQNAAA